jgi:hypothetical protein
MTIQSHFPSVSNNIAFKSWSQGSNQGLRARDDASQALSRLQSKALDVLASEIPGMESSDLKALDAADYTPDKVAARIGDFVAMGLANAKAQGKTDAEVQALYESAVKGVEKGFKDAKQILSDLNLLNGKVGEQVEETEKLTFDALAKLSPSQQEQAVSTPSTRAYAMAERYQRADDFSLTLKTQDGDTVKVRFSQAEMAQGAYALAEDDEGNQVELLDISRSQKTGYSFSVEGDLSEDEIEAIQSLVQDVGEVANDFFGGDVQKAFEQATDIAFDSSQLASMNLRMSRTEQYSAVQRYQETQRMETPVQEHAGRRLGHLRQDLSDSFQKPALDFLGQAGQFADQLMRGLVEQDTRFKDAIGEQQELYQGYLNRLLGSVESMYED